MAGVKAIAVYLRSRGIAQVSTNITQPDRTGIYEVFSLVEREAKALGIDILESELIGAIRESALVEAVRSAMKFSDLSSDAGAGSLDVVGVRGRRPCDVKRPGLPSPLELSWRSRRPHTGSARSSPGRRSCCHLCAGPPEETRKRRRF